MIRRAAAWRWFVNLCSRALRRWRGPPAGTQDVADAAATGEQIVPPAPGDARDRLVPAGLEITAAGGEYAQAFPAGDAAPQLAEGPELPSEAAPAPEDNGGRDMATGDVPQAGAEEEPANPAQFKESDAPEQVTAPLDDVLGGRDGPLQSSVAGETDTILSVERVEEPDPGAEDRMPASNFRGDDIAATSHDLTATASRQPASQSDECPCEPAEAFLLPGEPEDTAAAIGDPELGDEPEAENLSGGAPASTAPEDEASGLPDIAATGNGVARELEEDRAAADPEVEEPAADGQRSPPAYRPRLQRTRVKRSAPAGGGTEGAAGMQDLEADLLISFRPGNWGIRLSALLKRPAGTEDVTVTTGEAQIELGPLDDRLLEPVSIDDENAALSDGLLFDALGLPVRWRRSTRPLHVFGEKPSVTGFLSIPRLVIGQENVVVCVQELRDAVTAQFKALGADEAVRVEGPGVPAGWMCWRNVRPARPATPDAGDPVLHALDPLPAVSIEFIGGMQIAKGRWLEGYPPGVRLLGLAEEGEQLTIDGEPAVEDADGAWSADGWDALGRHRVEYGGVTAAYTIDAGASMWDWWPAHAGGIGALSGGLAGPNGPILVHQDRNACLIGAGPGDVCCFSWEPRVDLAIARPRFDPVWLVSGGSGRRKPNVCLVGLPRRPGPSQRQRASSELVRWVRVIRSVGRRAGLSNETEAELWREYVSSARAARRRRA